VVNRIGVVDIQEHFFSKESIDVLEMMKGSISNSLDSLLEHIIDKFPHNEMLRTKNIRDLLLTYLRPEEAQDLCKQLGITVSDSNQIYEKLKRISFQKNSKNERVLFDFFEEDFVKYVSLDDTSAPNIRQVNADHELFGYQRQSIEKITSYLNNKECRCLLHMPTGSGKTVTAIHTIANFFLNNEPSLVIWLAYNEELCEQAANQFINTWKNMGNRTIPILNFFGKHSLDLIKITKEKQDGFIIASLGKMHEADKKQDVFLSTLADRVSYVIIDEAHQAPAPTYRNILEQLVEKHEDTTKLLGLSATPGRTSSENESDTNALANLFYHNKVTLEIEKYENPIEYLINERYIAKPKVKTISIDTPITNEDIQKINRNPHDIPQTVLDNLGKNAQRTLLEISQIRDLINLGHKRIMVFGVSVRNSMDISTILGLLGHTSFHVDSNTSVQRRTEYVKKYKEISDEVIVMCNFGVFTAGFDAPHTSAVVVARPTKSLVLYSQMVGRAMRGKKVGGHNECEIRTIVDTNLTHFTNIIDNFFEWEDVW